MSNNNEINIPQDTIIDALARAVSDSPNKIFLDFSGETYTFSDVDTLSTQIAHGLLEQGIKEGDTVASVIDNNIDAVCVWIAINKIGAISAPVNTAFKGEFLKAQLNDCQASIVIVEADYVKRVTDIIDGLNYIKAIYCRGDILPQIDNYKNLNLLNDLRINSSQKIEIEVKPDTPSMLVYTSGTTGASKGCIIPHNMCCNMGWNAVVHRKYKQDDVLWSALPLFHLNAIAGSVVTGIICKCRIAISPRFSVSNFWPEIERSGATIVNLLGSMVSLLADAPENESSKNCYGQLRVVNAAPFAPSVVEKWVKRFGIKGGGSGAYGMTEAATISTTRSDDPIGPPASSGIIGRDFEVKIVDENDIEVPIGSTGEIIVRPNIPNIMAQGYWKRPDDTVKAWRNLWLHTGDLGRIDENNYLYFVDRKKDYIRRRGENISTFEMEAVFRQHPAIQDVAIHAVLSPMGEDEVKVTAELLPDVYVSEEELCKWSIERVPYFAVPQYIEFRESLPRSATGKVLKEELRQDGKTATTWDREEAGLTFSRR